MQTAVTTLHSKWFLRIFFAVIAAGAAFIVWRSIQPKGLGEGLTGGNGRIEAVEIDIATKTPGRIREILVNEGDFVAADQIVARMDTEVLDAQLREAKAGLRQAESALETARSQVAQRESEKEAALAVVAQREAELDVARKRLARSEALALEGAIALQELDDDRAGVQRAQAALSAAKSHVAAADAAITTARSHVVGAGSVIEASRATIQRIRAEIADSSLKSPRDGRVQFRLAQPGEVLGAGGRVLTLIDLADVYMNFFLPTAEAGRVALGTEVRLVVDAAPQYVFPARVSFVSDVAQFTPKTVETAVERQKLMFRIKAQIDPDLLRKHVRYVKTGLPAMAYVRLDPRVEWPADLQIRLP